MPDKSNNSLARNLGAFFGHIVKAVKTDPARAEKERQRREIRRETEEEDRGDVILRRTIIEEIEIKQSPAADAHDDEMPETGRHDD